MTSASRVDGLEIDGGAAGRTSSTRWPAFSDAPAPAVTRVVFTETRPPRPRRTSRRSAPRRRSTCARTRSGNTFARWAGTEPDAARGRDRLAHRRHPQRRPLRRHGRRARRPRGDPRARARPASRRAGRSSWSLFTSEEPTRFGIGCLGSRLLSGALDPSADAQPDAMATGGRSTTCRHGGRLHRCALVGARSPPAPTRRSSSCTSSRGRCSSAGGLDIGVVTAIAAPASLRVVIEGEGGHAGAVLMPDRRDAFLAGRRDRAGRRSRGTRHRLDRHGRHGGRVRRVPGRRQQRAQPDAARGRRPRHRPGPARRRARGASATPARRLPSRRGVTRPRRADQRRPAGPLRTRRSSTRSTAACEARAASPGR